MKQIYKDVCAALIERDGLILVAQRMAGDSFGGLWEFPGGAVEEGETIPGALKREIAEELGVDVVVGDCVYTVEDEIPTLKIKIFLHACTILGAAQPRPIECAAVRWVRPGELEGLQLAPADIKIARWLAGARTKTGK